MRDRIWARKKAEATVALMTVAEQATQLRYNSPAIKHLHIPEYNWWNEALHGVARSGTATVFPAAIALASMFDDDMMWRIGDAISTEGRARYHSSTSKGDRGIYKGLTYWSPNINIFRDPRWGRGHETYGEDPYLTGTLGVAYIRGIQGDDTTFLKAAACVKHLAVHSGPEALRHEFDAKVSKKDLWETYLPAFERCVKKGQVEGAMGGYNCLNGEPCCGSRTLIHELLREKWGFEGYFVSDCWALCDFHESHRVTDTAEESAVMALKAGCDLNCGNTYLQILKAWEDGLVTTEDISKACKRVLTTRYLLGEGEETPWNHISYTEIDSPKHAELNLEAARNSIVLLKNDEILPLDRSAIKTIAVIGPNADSRTALQGNYHGTASHYTTILQGIQAEVKDSIRILYAEGCQLTEEKTERLAERGDRFAEAIAIAECSDVVILCLGLDETIEGEAHHISTGEKMGGDKEDLLLPKVQRELAEYILNLQTPVVICLMSGSAIDLSTFDDRAKAIFQTWYPGACGGEAFADILLGKISPSGKLPITVYNSQYKLPEYTDYSMKNRTYRYLETEAQYSFGYGLTYSKVVVLDAWFEQILDFTFQKDRIYEVRVLVENQGSVETGEVIQIYVHMEHSRFAPRNASLCGYQRIYLKPGEKKQVLLKVEAMIFTVVDDQGERCIDTNDFTLSVGTHGADRRSEILTKTKNVQIELHMPWKGIKKYEI